MSKLIEYEIIEKDFLKNISEKFSIPYDLLTEELGKLEKIRITRSKYSCNHNFFASDNELSFYWAGFIAADGCAYKKGQNKTLNIALSNKDENHLLKFKEHICFDGILHKSITKHSLKNPKWNDSSKVSLQISSAKIFEDLERFNIVPNKTKIYTFPKWLKEHKLVNHFMRGYIDGDGSFFYDASRDRVCFELRGTYDFLCDFKDVLDSNINIKNKSNVTTPDSTSKIKYYGKKTVPYVVDFIYNNSSFCLQRKYDIAIKSKL